MNKIFFKSERYFALHDAHVSHGQVLFRSQKNEHEKHNIDIVFFNTSYIQISLKLNGVIIRKIEEKPANYNSVNKYLSYPNNSLFEIESNGEEYLVAASFFRIFENDLNFNESSLNFENTGREIEIQ
jgi:hypothetical protein